MNVSAHTASQQIDCRFNPTTGHLILSAGGASVPLTALWLRERSEAPDQLDLNSHQRYFDPTLLPADLRIVEAEPAPNGIAVSFSDGHRWHFDPTTLGIEAGLLPDPLALPSPEPWTAETLSLPIAEWSTLDDTATMRDLLAGFFRSGVVVLRGTPTVEDSLITIAQRFGPIRETNWGRLFNVRTEAKATDLAYTGLALTAHTDNPYRRSVPGIQFLHCLENGATGGESTIIDGLAIAERLRADAPELFEVMTTLPVSYRYRSDSVDDRMDAPVLDIGRDGRLKHIRLSTRLDFPPAADPETLALFFEGRRRLATYAADPAFEVRFKMRPGDCLVMDNHRTLHGRGAFAEDGRRFLQGCYIDHDGPECLYRVTTRKLAESASTASRSGMQTA